MHSVMESLANVMGMPWSRQWSMYDSSDMHAVLAMVSIFESSNLCFMESLPAMHYIVDVC